MINTKELLHKLPGSWEDLKLEDFVKVMDVEVSESEDYRENTWQGVDNITRVIGALTDTPVDALEDLPYVELAALSTKLTFMQKLPEVKKKCVIEWKPLDQVKYNDYITFQSFQGKHLQNLPTIIKAFSKNDMTDEEIGNLSTSEVVAGFFTLQKHVSKFLRHTILCSRVKLMKQLVKENWNRLIPYRKRTVK